MKTLGIVTMVALICGAAAYFGGYMDGDINVQITDKGRQAVTDGLEAARNGINSGLGAAQDQMNKGVDHLQSKSATQKPQ